MGGARRRAPRHGCLAPHLGAQRGRSRDPRAGGGVSPRAQQETDDVDRAMASLLRELGKVMGWSVGLFWARSGAALALRSSWHEGDSGRAFVERSGTFSVFARGIGLPGRAWHEGRPIWVEDFRESSSFPRAPAASVDDLRAAIALPVIDSQREVIGVMEFLGRGGERPPPDTMATMSLLCDRIGQFIRRKATEAELARSNAKPTLFADAAAHDLSEPLRTMRGLAEVLERRYGSQLDDTGRELLDNLLAAGARGEALVQAILAYARVGGEQVIGDEAGRQRRARCRRRPPARSDDRRSRRDGRGRRPAGGARRRRHARPAVPEPAVQRAALSRRGRPVHRRERRGGGHALALPRRRQRHRASRRVTLRARLRACSTPPGAVGPTREPAPGLAVCSGASSSATGGQIHVDTSEPAGSVFEFPRCRQSLARDQPFVDHVEAARDLLRRVDDDRHHGRAAAKLQEPVAVRLLGAVKAPDAAEARDAAALPELGRWPMTLERVRSATASCPPGQDAPLEKLTVYGAEHVELVRRLRAAGARGVTCLRGIWGSTAPRSDGDRLLQLRRGASVMTVVVDSPQQIARCFEVIDSGLVTSEALPRA